MVRSGEHLFFNSNYVATQLPNNPDYCKLAESYGIKAVECDNIDDLENTISIVF